MMLSEMQDLHCCQQQQQQQQHHLYDSPAEQRHQAVEQERYKTRTAEENTLHSSGLPTMDEVSSSSSTSSRSTTTARKSRRLISHMNFMTVLLVQIVLLLSSSCSKRSSVGLLFVDATRDKTLSANEMAKYWIDAGDVLEQLDNYQALWIKVHGCV